MSIINTRLSLEEYRCTSIPVQFEVAAEADTKTEPSSFRQDAVGETLQENLPIGPEVQLEVEEYSFDSLIRKLVECERQYGFSSLEMFSQYINGEIDLEEGIGEWFSLFVLCLGTQEVRQFSCP